MTHTIATSTHVGQHDVTLVATDFPRFIVTYGADRVVFEGSNAAWQEYTSCVRHQWECAGNYDAPDEVELD